MGTTLTLEIVGSQASVSESNRRKVFRERGGTIGRLTENDWVLPHPYVSSRHALIRFVEGTYLIEDMSRNGIFVNSLDHRLERGQAYALRAGDRLIVDPYEIAVSLTSDAAESADPFAADSRSWMSAAVPPSGAAPPPRASSPLVPGGDGGEVVDPLRLLGLVDARPPAPDAPRAEDLGRAAPVQEHFRPPRPVTPPEPAHPSPPAPAEPLIPAHYDPLGSGDSAIVPVQGPSDDDPFGMDVPARREAPVPPAAEEPRLPPPSPPVDSPPELRPPAEAAPMLLPHQPAASGPSAAEAPMPGPSSVQAPLAGGADRAASGGLEDVLAGAGLDGVAVTPELARQFGAILRIVVAGLMDVLQARQRLKDEFRMSVTTFKPADNNPLKFSANVEDALHNLLVKRNAAYLGPVEAFAHAFDDVRDHQLAMLAGLRTAFESLLADFAPERLQEQFDRQVKKTALVAVPARLRYWELYCERFHDIVRDPDTSFRELFGEEFAEAYEQQLARLKALRGTSS